MNSENPTGPSELDWAAVTGAPSIGQPLCGGAINCTVEDKAGASAINCTEIFDGSARLKSHLQFLISQSLSDASKRAYQSDIEHFKKWGGTIPACSETVAAYLAALSASLAVATIQRRVASLSKTHRAVGGDDPTKSEIVRSTMRGIRRTLGVAQREAKPILREDLFKILERMSGRPKDIRDKALLLVGFAGAFRRSELVGLDVADIEHVRQGVVVKLRRSKTDQDGIGRKIGIPFGRSRWCPVNALSEWLEKAAISEGSIFRSIDRHGHIANQRLADEAVSLIVKERVEGAGFNPDAYSGHSLRAGLATSAAMAGASTWKIRAQTGHASEAMLARYIRDGDLFTNNAVGAVL